MGSKRQWKNVPQNIKNADKGNWFLAFSERDGDRRGDRLASNEK